MYKLRAPAREPFWLDFASVVPGLRIEFLPITPVMMDMAEREAARIYDEPGVDEDPTRNSRLGVAFVDALAHAGIAAWEGVGDENDRPAPVTPANIDLLLGALPIRKAIDRLYVTPALRVAAEKNESALSPTGTSETEDRTTAAPAA